MAFADSQEELNYSFGGAVNAGLDTGYLESNELSLDDPHFGWELGTFTISGYTRVKENAQGIPVFLKTADDKIKLTFKLNQDINVLNGKEELSINDDSNGYDQHFGVERTDFGRGTLIIRQTNYKNETGEPQVYTNYLNGIEIGADTEVVLLEEGNYEVQLDYEIKKVNNAGFVPLPASYSDYKIEFKFEIRNGNCMVFPMDLMTKSELTNEAYAPNGFYLDLAKSRYLDVSIKREVMTAGTNGLIEDTRFNGPARDGDKYSDDGIYTIKATNKITDEETIKKIYVGDDPILKASAVTGLSIEQIQERVAAGDIIADDGQLITPEEAKIEQSGFSVALVVAIIAALVCAVIVVRRRHPKQDETVSSVPNEVLSKEKISKPLGLNDRGDQ